MYPEEEEDKKIIVGEYKRKAYNKQIEWYNFC